MVYADPETVLIPEIPPLSFQCASQDSSSSTNNLGALLQTASFPPRPDCLRFVTQLSAALLLSASAWKMSSLLLVTWLLCEIREAVQQSGQLVREGRSGSQSAWLTSGPCAWCRYRELLSRSQLPALHVWDLQHQRNSPRRKKRWRHLGGLGRGKCFSGHFSFLGGVSGSETEKVVGRCPSSR